MTGYRLWWSASQLQILDQWSSTRNFRVSRSPIFKKWVQQQQPAPWLVADRTGARLGQGTLPLIDTDYFDRIVFVERRFI